MTAAEEPIAAVMRTTALFRRHRRLALLATPLVLFVIAGLLAPIIAPDGPTATDLSASLHAPSWQHLFGTDKLGRDQATRILYAARSSLTVAASVMAIAFGVGVTIGSIAGYLGGRVERLTLRLVELALSMPTLVVALAILGIRGNGLGNLVFALAVFAWAPYARIARSVVASHRASPPIDALRVLGARPRRILGRHLVPLAIRPALVYASTDLGTVVLATASLSFLGLGISPPTPEWGQMLVESRPFLGSALWLALTPGIAVTLVVVSSNLVSEHLGTAPGQRALRRIRRPTRNRRHEPIAATAPPAAEGTLGLYEVTDLSVSFPGATGPTTVLHDVSFSIERGRTLALVGESGSGKTVSVMGPLGLLPGGATVTGSARLDGRELIGLSDRELRSIRGPRIGVVFQDPFSSLNPLRTIGAQLDEAVRNGGTVHGTRVDIRRRTVELLAMVELDRPEHLCSHYSHELSGGMRQRVLIAIALAGEPDLLIADEPTSALDVTIQTQLVHLLQSLAVRANMAMIFISHDLAVVSEIADDIIVMYSGRAIEQGPCATVLADPAHPYTRGLLDAIPQLGVVPGTRFRTMPDADPAIDADSGCRFAPRCAWAQTECLATEPAMAVVDADDVEHETACHIRPFHRADVAPTSLVNV